MAAEAVLSIKYQEMRIFNFFPNNHLNLWNYTKKVIHLINSVINYRELKTSTLSRLLFSDNHLAFGEKLLNYKITQLWISQQTMILIYYYHLFSSKTTGALEH
jgi:hypothetical protein